MALALFLGTAVGMAQENRGERPDPSKRIEQMVTDLGLNETQAKEFKAVMEEMRPNRDASGERPSREEMEKKRNEADAKLKKILTDEQYKKVSEHEASERTEKREIIFYKIFFIRR